MRHAAASADADWNGGCGTAGPPPRAILQDMHEACPARPLHCGHMARLLIKYAAYPATRPTPTHLAILPDFMATKSTMLNASIMI